MNLVAITAELAANQEVAASEFLSDLCAATIAMYPNGLATPPWMGYFAKEGRIFVGTCAFKAAPISGEVEIAYFTFPGNEGRGVATSMARELIQLAFKHGVRRIKAQTLPEANASTRILEKLGFEYSGPVNHSEDGEVWEWYRTGTA